MTTHFITRHPGAVDWIKRQGLAIDQVHRHLDPAIVQAGDTVIGTLPVHLAGEVCARGATFINLTLDIPSELRGKELSAEVLDACGARLERFDINGNYLQFGVD